MDKRAKRGRILTGRASGDKRVSTGCQTCIKRHIKCDEAQPSCQRCERSGRICEGYNRGFLFIDERPKVFTRRTRPLRKPGTNAASSASSSGSEDFKLAFSPSPSRAIIPSKIQLYLNFFVAQMANSRFQFRPTVSNQDNFLTSSLWRIVTAEADTEFNSLDTIAARVLVTTYFARTHADMKLAIQGYAMYGKLLPRLSQAIGELLVGSNNPSQKGSAKFEETLFAVYIMTLYELSSSNSYGAWIPHAAALGKLIEMRGPEINVTDDGREILRNMRYYIILEATAHRRPTFLAEKKWQNPLGSTAAGVSGYMNPKKLLDHLVDIIAMVPGLLGKQRQTMKNLHAMTTPNKKKAVTDTALQALRIMQHLDAWHSTFKETSACQISVVSISEIGNQTEVPVTGQDGPEFETIYRYDCLETANAVLMGSSTFVTLRRVVINMAETQMMDPCLADSMMVSLLLPAPSGNQACSVPLHQGAIPLAPKVMLMQKILRSIEYHFLPLHAIRDSFNLTFPMYVAYWGIHDKQDPYAITKQTIQEPEYDTWMEPDKNHLREKDFIMRVISTGTGNVGLEMGKRTFDTMKHGFNNWPWHPSLPEAGLFVPDGDTASARASSLWLLRNCGPSVP